MYIVQVRTSLDTIEKCSTFTDFVKSFSQFGKEMVNLAHVSGDRQNVSHNFIIAWICYLMPLLTTAWVRIVSGMYNCMLIW